VLRINIYIFLASIFLVIFSCDDLPQKQTIYGVWKGEHYEKEILFEFKNDHSCVLTFKDKPTQSVQIVNGHFEIDFSKKPIILSIRNIPQLNHPLYTIVKFIDIHSIRLANFAPHWKLRPISFDRNTSMNLKRRKKLVDL